MLRGLVCRESRGGFRDKGKEQGRGLVDAGKMGQVQGCSGDRR